MCFFSKGGQLPALNKNKRLIIMMAFVLIGVTCLSLKEIFKVDSSLNHSKKNSGEGNMSGKIVKLPSPELKGGMSVEQAIANRRSRRDYNGKRPLRTSQISLLLWATQGCTGAGCLRASPSAGATYPLYIFVVVGKGAVEGIDEGIYEYEHENHQLILKKAGDFRKQLSAAALGQDCVRSAPVSIVMTADYSRTTGRYGKRGIRYVHIEVGHVGQNIYLEAESLGLGTVAVGAFDDGLVEQILGVKGKLSALYIMPVGFYR